MSKSIVTIGRILPWDKVDHAGGLYVKFLYDVLAKDCRFNYIGPVSARNLLALSSNSAKTGSFLLGIKNERVRKLVDSLAWHFNPALPEVSFLIALKFSKKMKKIIRNADVLDLQWGEFSTLAPYLRKLNPTAKIISTHHDVLTQKYDRLCVAKSRGLLFSTYYQKLFRNAKRRYVKALSYSDEAIVFSNKDKNLLEALLHGRTLKLRKINPPLAEAVSTSDEVSKKQFKDQVLFVGAMRRPENDEAAKWFISEVWDKVRGGTNLKFTVVGADPSKELKKSAENVANVEIKGFVEDLVSEYAKAVCVVVPLMRGAGVKFKTLEAILSGVPVISTSIGVEGIPHSRDLWGVCDDADSFVEQLEKLLREIESAQMKASVLKEKIQEQYGLEQFQAKVNKIYGV